MQGKWAIHCTIPTTPIWAFLTLRKTNVTIELNKGYYDNLPQASMPFFSSSEDSTWEQDRS